MRKVVETPEERTQISGDVPSPRRKGAFLAQRRYGDAIEIAQAILSSPRHTTLNEGFAKQCVEFVKALERESGYDHSD